MNETGSAFGPKVPLVVFDDSGVRQIDDLTADPPADES